MTKTRSIPYWTTSVFSSAVTKDERRIPWDWNELRLLRTTTVWRMLQSESESYVTTDGESASLSWNKASVWVLRPDLYYYQSVASLLMWEALSDQRTGLSFTIAAGLRQHNHSQVRVPRGSWPQFTVSDSRLPNLEDQVPVFISHRNRLAQLYPQALGSIFVAIYDSEGYGGGIRHRLHTSFEATISS
jgi:hypothetical protein